MERQFPEQYSKPLQKVLNAISYTPNVVGSSADHRILYSADYDLLEDVVYKRTSVRSFQTKVKNLQKIGKIIDIKCGEISEWNLLKKAYVENSKVHKYDRVAELKHAEHLWSLKIITDIEYKYVHSLLKPHLNPIEFLETKKELRFGLLRWTPLEVEQGYKVLRNESILYLEQAFKSKGITKLDLIAWVETKYVEVSNIILWTNRSGSRYAYIPAVKKALKENILEYEAEQNYVKVAKRMYSLAKQFKDTYIIDELTNILNSPIGKLYMVVADMEILEFPVNKARKRKEMDTLKDQFAKLYFNELAHATPETKLSYLKEVLQHEMKLALTKAKLLPIPRDYMI